MALLTVKLLMCFITLLGEGTSKLSKKYPPFPKYIYSLFKTKMLNRGSIPPFPISSSVTRGLWSVSAIKTHKTLNIIKSQRNIYKEATIINIMLRLKNLTKN